MDTTIASGKATDKREAERRQRVDRLLGGELRKHVKRASEMQFDYSQAAALATNRWLTSTKKNQP